ncbi:ABC transporter permease [Microlunatus panaciterrae]|uniref:Peptide/nickel transport system permease protein n=1 Tax=Microlunatus panaciterrae TaxID=400768 RepID=A0ABS2RM64_9ACTN|nr:ABC transporter permease [Microlunatus panaciterrae]MBM7799597.1 peptide/nickel transport system permease protein [Microlunatus panaciterrae]
MNFTRYLGRKALWYIGALFVALMLNFFLPRLIPGNPVDSLVSQLSRGGGSSGEQMKAIYENYMREFGLDKPLWQQFFIYMGQLFQGNLGTSFGQYPASVNGLVANALPWSIAIQLPAILIGWVVGNTIGAIAAFKGGWFDRGAFVSSLFLSSMPYYCLAILLLFGFGVILGVLPVGGAYSFGLSPELSMAFFGDAISYFWLPFWSLVLIFIGGQAVGMRSMAIYELGSDYVNYGRGLGLSDNRIVRYIFRNAMLPQITGLALSIGGLVGGALITELVFSYPGIGTLLFNAISQNDYPVIQAVTLIITLAVLAANFAVEIAYGLIDPRIRAASIGDR